jgi:anti-anti-sigma factor
MSDGHSTHAATITLHGDIDCANVHTVATATAAALRDGAVFITVDLDDVDFMNAALLGALVAARGRCRQQGAHLRVKCGKPRLRRLFTVTRLDDPLLREFTGAIPAQRSRRA